jgi:PPP family 3-phenylpropionic acid transporter
MIALRLTFFYAAMFGSIGVFLPYWPIWLQSRGLDAMEIGLIIGASFWPRTVTSLMIPNAADRLGRRRAAMIILALLTLIGLLAFTLVREFWLFMLLGLVTGATWSSILPLGEAISLDQVARHGLDYGRIRLWGSVTFILMSLGGGYALDLGGADIIYLLILSTLALIVIACCTMPETMPAAFPAGGASLGRLFRRKDLWQVVLASAMIQASHALIYGFGSLHWRSAGLDDRVIGWLWAEGVIAEVLLFLWGTSLLRRMSHGRLIAVGGALATLRWTLNGLSADLPLLILTQALHAGSFALTFLAALHYIRDSTPPELQASVQGFYAAIGFAPLFGVVTPLSGWLYGQVQGSAFLAMAALAADGALLVLGLPALPSVPRKRDDS